MLKNEDTKTSNTSQNEKQRKSDVKTEVNSLLNNGSLDPESFKLRQDFDVLLSGKKEIIKVPVTRPHRQQWFCINPSEEWRITVGLVELKEENDVYLVSPGILSDISVEVLPKVLVTCQTREGMNFLWPIKMPSDDGRIDTWNQSALVIVREYADKYIRIIPNRQSGAYEVMTSSLEIPPPVWPKQGFEYLFSRAFKDRIINDISHPILRRLRGES